MPTPPHVASSADREPIGLLGEAHRQLLADLIDRFEQIKGGNPRVERVVLLTAASGTGKSRIVRELYRYLQEVQPDPGYWPALPDDDAVRGTGAGVDPLPNRKVLGPAVDGFVWHAGALPSFTWWTFDCGRMPSGGLVEAVEQARPALQLHLLPAMQAKAAHLGVGEKTLRLLEVAREPAKEAFKEGALERLNQAIAELAGAAVPGLGLAIDWMTRGVQAAGRVAEERQLRDTEVSFVGRVGHAHRTLGTEFADLILATVHPRVPAVVVVEDAHLMGEGLAEFLHLVSIRAEDRPVLVIATAWPEGEHSTYVQWRIQVRNSGNLQEWGMPDLGLEDRVALVHRVAPATPTEDAVRVAERYPNPLALKLFLGLKSVARVIGRHDGALTLEPLDLDTLPATIKTLYAQRIQELPPEVRQALECADGTLPAGLPTWPYHPGVVATAAAEMGTDRQDIAAGLDQAVRQGVTAEENGLHSFREHLFAEVLAEHVDPLDRVELQNGTRRVLREHIATARGDRYLLPNPSDIDVHAARWLTELVNRTPVTVEDTVALTISARALIAAYQYKRGAELFRQALSHLPPDHPDTLELQNSLAGAYDSVGDLGRAVPLFEAVLEARTRVLGPDHPDTLGSRINLAYAYRARGDLGQAVLLFEAVLADSTRVLGPDHPDTLTSRSNLAYAYQASGDLRQAIPLYEAVLTDALRVLGPDHPLTLTVRSNLASAYQASGDRIRAIPLFKETLADRTRVLGADHPDTLASRNNLAGAYRAVGDLGRAIPLYEALLADAVRILGRAHPTTRTIATNLHVARGEAK